MRLFASELLSRADTFIIGAGSDGRSWNPLIFFSMPGEKMATAAFINQDPHIVPLEEANIAGLESLFDEQCEEWLALLDWDYTYPSRLIRKVARERDLTGFAAVAGGAIVGFAFYVVEEGRCSIGDMYVSKPWRGRGVDRRLLEAILDELALVPRLRRIESQCVAIGNEAANDLLEASGFERFERHYMLIDLAQVRAAARVENTLDGTYSTGRVAEGRDLSAVSIKNWEEPDFEAAARIIYESYRGEYDSRINSQYASLEGCAELLSVLIEHVWCGEFLPQVSRVAVSSRGKRVGVLIASRIADGIGHISQISILPDYQGRGIGRRMIDEALLRFNGCGFKRVSLAVTATNANAFHLYQSCGFRTKHSFPVFYRERR